MANIQFRLQSSTKEKKPISVRFKVGRKTDVTANTGFSINEKDWTETNLPKKNNDVNKLLHKSLLKLQSFLEDRYNEALTDSTVIDKFWLSNQINECFERVEKKDTGILANHIQFIIDNANTRKVSGRNQIGISKSRVKGYETFKKIIEDYQKTAIKKQIHFLDINKTFVDKFTNWLINTRNYSKNYSGKQLDNLKTVCLDAEKLEIKTNPYIKQIEGFAESNEERFIVTLSFDELEQIRTCNKITNDAHLNARKWILIGCEIGQRASDLLNITKEDIRYKGGRMYLDVIQRKTKKSVTIGIINPYVVDIMKNEFPYKVSTQKLNEHIKKVCEIAEINEKVEGKKLNPEAKKNKPETMRKIQNFYPKWELITTHSFRRSFASNYYKKIPTAVLIQITGHSKESLFLNYINQREDKDANADLFMQFYERLNKDKEPGMTVIRNAQ
ncbi:integrase family protein [Flavobacterium limnosediminis JC2902]|uniref:Integrase family protein n=1 Tax=Flavobacterium limnosediminis JC2902 TaxID=1341181 RepID=V6STH8_9FLAO|nr:tyrosine-type recombinase/integrase [Flavobacterium limnosediminis]ESU29487.1 integrase family protein [Flavobacterium limnosediminis JC2902]